MKLVIVEDLESVLTLAVMLQHVRWPLELSVTLGRAAILAHANSRVVGWSVVQVQESVTLQKLAQEIQQTVHKMCM